MPKRINPLKDERTFSKWTTWECYNVILKGLVDELISLGASPQLKSIALQLWAKYLSKLGIAFTSTEEELLPKFGHNPHTKNYAAIQDFILKKRRKLKRLLKGERTPESHVNGKMVNVGKEMDSKSIEAQLAYLEEALNEIRCRWKVLEDYKKAYYVRRNAKRHFDCSLKIAEEPLVGYSKFFGRPAAGAESFRSSRDPMFLRLPKVLALVMLALSFTKDNIQLSDVIRWIFEGDLSYMYPIRFLPNFFKLNKANFVRLFRNPSYRSVEKNVFNIARLLEIIELPKPNLLSLSRRFVLELQLPSEIHDYVERLIASCNINESMWMLSYETIVISFIIIVLKSLFGLDDYTEHSISEFATKINCMMDEKSGSKLFVWDDWVRYIECRKSIISNDYPKHYETKNDSSLFVDSYVHYTSKIRSRQCSWMGDNIMWRCTDVGFKRRLPILQDGVEQFPECKKMKTTHDFFPSLTPKVSNLNVILSHWYSHGYIGDSAPPIEILAFDHTKTSVDFLVDPNKIIQLAHNQGIDVIVQKMPMHLEYKQTKDQRFVTQIREKEVEVGLYTLDGGDVCNSNDLPQLLSDVAPRELSKEETKKYDSMEKSNYSLDVDNMLIDPKKKEMNKSDKENISLLNDSDAPQEIQFCKHSNKHRTSKNKEESSSARTHHDETKTKSNTLTLNMPLSDYWVFKMLKGQPDPTFVPYVESGLPLSFVWLLKECSEILLTKVVDLYKVFRQVEELCIGNIDLKGLL